MWCHGLKESSLLFLNTCKQIKMNKFSAAHGGKKIMNNHSAVRMMLIRMIHFASLLLDDQCVKGKWPFHSSDIRLSKNYASIIDIVLAITIYKFNKIRLITPDCITDYNSCRHKKLHTCIFTT